MPQETASGALEATDCAQAARWLVSGSNPVRTMFEQCLIHVCSAFVPTVFVHVRSRFEQCSVQTPIVQVPNYEGHDCRSTGTDLDRPRSTIGHKSLNWALGLKVIRSHPKRDCWEFWALTFALLCTGERPPSSYWARSMGTSDPQLTDPEG